MMDITIMCRSASTVFFTACAIGVSCAQSPITLQVTTHGRPAGQATYTQKLLPNNGKWSELLIVTSKSRGGKKAANRLITKIVTTYDAKGAMVSADNSLYPEGQPPFEESKFSFDDKGVTVQQNVGRSHRTFRANLAPGQKTNNPSVYWFIRTHPKKGQTCSAFVFNLFANKWERCDYAFLGGNLVRMMSRGRAVDTTYDSTGKPVSIKDGDVLMSRG